MLLLDCLRALPTVASIFLESCSPVSSNCIQIMDDSFFGYLTVSEDDPTPVCPQLEKIVLSECKHVSEEALLAFAQSRSDGLSRRATSEITRLRLLDARFRRARPEYSTDSEKHISSKIEQLHSEGVVVKWKYLVPEVPAIAQIPDSPWEGLPTSPYTGWNPEYLSRHIRD
ncbi:hypothetical protein EV361DRAFT_427610 [Lentinula raphanica]|nr:hypothetical protein EV361DRAFT_427610 [Lentinula raphanica]